MAGWVWVTAGFSGTTAGLTRFCRVGLDGGVGSPLAFGSPCPCAAFGTGVGSGVAGVSLTLGFTTTGAVAPGGAGGAPLVPGTGSALTFGKPCPGGKAFGATLAGAGVGVPALGVVGTIEALGGTGNLPCWIRLARWATAGGSAGVVATAPRGNAGKAGAPGAGGAGGLLMTLLMTVVLWMLAKMMLFGGGAT